MGVAETMAAVSDMATPTHEMKRALRRLASPTAWPTRVTSAMPKVSGTMKTTDEKLRAIWCADTWITPKRATSRLMTPKALTSAKYVTPMGRPRRSMGPMDAVCGHSQCVNG